MCRNIKTLHNFSPPATAEEIRASAVQFVRKLSGFTRPSKTNEAAFERAIERVQIMDATGYDAVWLAEHHFSGYSVCPSVHMMGTLADTSPPISRSYARASSPRWLAVSATEPPIAAAPPPSRGCAAGTLGVRTRTPRAARSLLAKNGDATASA